MFKFYEDAVKFIGVLACLATVGMIYSSATLVLKHVSTTSVLQSINQTNYFIVRLKVDERAGQLSLPHLGITKTEKPMSK